jgi:preprotein translocase subunit SecF
MADDKIARIGAYRSMLIIPVILLLLSAGFLAYGYVQTGEWFQRSIELKGGTLITVNSPSGFSLDEITSSLESTYGDVVVRELRSFSGYAMTIEVSSEANPDDVIGTLSSLGVDVTDSSTETIGPSLGESFWFQAQIGIIIAFILMGIIVFGIFRSFVPSIAVIMAAVSDIIVTLAMMQVFSIELSLASFAALLMLIGYSIDTDILLTTRVMKTEGSLGERIRSAFKTGITMTGTTIGVLVAILLTTSSTVLFGIASVLAIGLAIDVINTWLQNATILRWYAERRGL